MAALPAESGGMFSAMFYTVERGMFGGRGEDVAVIGVSKVPRAWFVRSSKCVTN